MEVFPTKLILQVLCSWLSLFSIAMPQTITSSSVITYWQLSHLFYRSVKLQIHQIVKKTHTVRQTNSWAPSYSNYEFIQLSVFYSSRVGSKIFFQPKRLDFIIPSSEIPGNVKMLTIWQSSHQWQVVYYSTGFIPRFQGTWTSDEKVE